MDNKEKKDKSWLNEDIEGAEELHQAHVRIFGDGSSTVSMPLEEYRKR